MSESKTYTLASGDEYTLPALADGVRFLGVSQEGYAVVESDGLSYGLTPCCGASATGSMTDDGEPAIVCRSCYAECDPLLGGPVLIDDPIAEDGVDVEALAEVLNAARAQVETLRLKARETLRDAPKASTRFAVRASILADAIDRVQATR